MVYIGACCVWFLLALAVAPGSAMNMTPTTKFVKGVPIHNYHFLKHFEKDFKDLQDFTTWYVEVRPEFEARMREICASTLLGKKHCHNVFENWAAFIFKGAELELVQFLDLYKEIVEFVEPDHVKQAADDDDDAVPEFHGVMQSDPVWNLDRIDQRRGLSSSYNPGLKGGGEGVHVYVFDTGMRTTHNEFQGRALKSLDFSSGSGKVCSPSDSGCAVDRKGHGTHCAGTIGGKTVGVANRVTLHAVKILADNGFGAGWWTTAAVDWVLKNGKRPAVFSMSLGTEEPYISAADKKTIDAAYNKGVTVVVAAGNAGKDACSYSPSYVPNAITVGSTTRSSSDRFSDFSNFGPCLDISAPGSNIESVSYLNDYDHAVKSGTSMACPAVSGAAALLLHVYPDLTPGQVVARLKNKATSIQTIDEDGLQLPKTSGKFLYVGSEWSAPSPSPRPRPPSPRPRPRPRPRPPSSRRRAPSPRPRPRPPSSRRRAPSPSPWCNRDADDDCLSMCMDDNAQCIQGKCYCKPGYCYSSGFFGECKPASSLAQSGESDGEENATYVYTTSTFGFAFLSVAFGVAIAAVIVRRAVRRRSDVTIPESLLG